MPTIGSASNNPQGYFSTKVTDRAQRKESLKLMENIIKYHKEKNAALLDQMVAPDTYSVGADFNRRQAVLNQALNDNFTAIESGVALPKNIQEVLLLYKERELEDHNSHETDTFVEKVAESLKKHQNKDNCYDLVPLLQDTEEILQEYLSKDFKKLKAAARGIFADNPQPLFEKAATYPETVRRLVDLIDLPTQNEQGWNLASQAAKAGNPKLAKAFEKAGFGPNLHTKAVVDFAKAMTEDSNDEKSADKKWAALKELMGITPLS